MINWGRPKLTPLKYAEPAESIGGLYPVEGRPSEPALDLITKLRLTEEIDHGFIYAPFR